MPAADRASGALYGLAIGDALGMPTQLLSRRQVTDRWGPLLTGFEPAPPGHPIAAGQPAGAVTDDTEQAVLLARMLVKGHGTLGPRDWAQALIGWDGANVPAAIDAGVVAATLAAGRGHWVAGADVAARIRWAVTLVSDMAPERAALRSQ